jgi:hypothetical protein
MHLIKSYMIWDFWRLHYSFWKLYKEKDFFGPFGWLFIFIRLKMQEKNIKLCVYIYIYNFLHFGSFIKSIDA